MGGASIVGQAFGMVGNVLGAVANYNAEMQQADIAERNARISDISAADAEQRGGYQAGKIREHGTKTISAQRAAAAESGLDTSAGSVGDLYDSTRMASELDAQTSKNNAAREAWGFRTQAADLRTNAKNIRDGAGLKEAATILGSSATSMSNVAASSGGNSGSYPRLGSSSSNS